MLRRRVDSIMLSLSEYAVVGPDATLAEAIEVLERSRVGLEPGRQAHRAVLVQDRGGAIVGKLGHLSFLRALLPERCSLQSSEVLDRAGVSDDMKQSTAGTFDLLQDEFANPCQRARSVRVGDVCAPAAFTVARDASLLEAVRVFLAHQTLSLLVTDGAATVGILRLVDLYDAIAGAVTQDACETEDGARP